MAAAPHVSLLSTTVRWSCLLLIFSAVAHGLKFPNVTKYSENDGCASVRTAYTSKGKGFERQDVPVVMIAGTHLHTCPQGQTCCTRNMEHKLAAQSRKDFDKAMADRIKLIRNTFISRTAKFDAFFTELLDNGKEGLHKMFITTYGLLYVQNARIFTGLFENLRAYYKGENLDLVDALDRFFSSLFRRMFQLLNAQTTFDEPYLACVTEDMDKLKPFGDVPAKLTKQVKQSFIAARTFVQGLAVGRDVILAISKLTPTVDCTSAFFRTTYCAYCAGMATLKPCNNFCMNVMKGCLAQHADLNDGWNKYIDALMKLATRLEGPFNIEAVVEPIKMKISDAIMNYQKDSGIITNKVFLGCGRPQETRKKRAASRDHARSRDRTTSSREHTRDRTTTDDRSTADHSESSPELVDAYSWKREPLPASRTTAAGTSLDRLVRDIRDNVSTARNFWKGLPDGVCNGLAAPLMDVTNCWNGNGKGRYLPEVVADGVRNQEANPEVDVNVRTPSSLVNDLILQLRQITSKLGSAYKGVDVDWIDTADSDDDDTEMSGSGSGSGSGQEIDPSGVDISFVPITHRPPVIKTHETPTVHSVPGSASTSKSAYTLVACVTVLAMWLYA